jgi:tetratricopeptide (TPR) repeat protein
MAEIALRREQIETGYQWILRAVAANPIDIHSHYQLAQFHLGQNNIAAAEAAARALVKIAPTPPLALRLLSELARRRGDLAAASDLAERALAAVPSDPYLLFHLSSIRLQQGDLSAASLAAKQAQALAPDHRGIMRQVAYLSTITNSRPMSDTDEAVT